MNLLICVTGSVAAIKDKELVRLFMEDEWFKVKVVYTERAL